MTCVYFIGSTVGLYPLLLQQFFIYRHDDLSFLYGQYLGYGIVWVFMDLIRVHNMVESGNYLHCCADWSVVTLKAGELVHTSQSKDGVW